MSDEHTDDILSQDEINDLLGKLDSGDDDVVESDDQTDDGPRISILDLQRPDLFTQSTFERLVAHANEWAEAIAAAWGVRSGATWTIEPTSADPLTLDEFRRSVANPGVFVTVGSRPGRRVLIEPHAGLAGALARTAIGYPPVGAAPELTALALRAVAGLISTTVGRPVLSTFGLDHRPADVSVSSDPALIDLTDSLDMVIVMLFTVGVEGGQQEMRLNVCIPSLLAALFAARARQPAAEPADPPEAPADVVSLAGRLEFPLSRVCAPDLDALRGGAGVSVDTSAVGHVRFSTSEGGLD